jgi:hypothetical protein
LSDLLSAVLVFLAVMLSMQTPKAAGGRFEGLSLASKLGRHQIGWNAFLSFFFSNRKTHLHGSGMVKLARR